jgi:hypothetical protein
MQTFAGGVARVGISASLRAANPALRQSASIHSFSKTIAQSSDVRNSKREYLLAQLRQKDAVIESLLKQVRVLLRLPITRLD